MRTISFDVEVAGFTRGLAFVSGDRRVFDDVDVAYLRRAMDLAAEAARAGDVPIGAVLVTPLSVFAARNEKELASDPTAHAEILAIREACGAYASWRLPPDSTLYVTKEPCPMCAGAIAAARVARLVFGCRDPKGGAAGSVIDVLGSAAVNHRTAVVGGVLADETAEQLRSFFAERRGMR